MSQQKTIIAETTDELDTKFNDFVKGKKTFGCQVHIMQKEGRTQFVETIWYTLDWQEKK